MSKLTAPAPTPIDFIPKIASSLRITFASQKTKPIEWRLVQLRKLYWAYVTAFRTPLKSGEARLTWNRLTDNADLIASACMQDLGKGAFETYITETGWCANDAIFVCNSLESWAKDEKAPDIAWTNVALRPKIRKDPLGCCLIIGYDGFPELLVLLLNWTRGKWTDSFQFQYL